MNEIAPELIASLRELERGATLPIPAEFDTSFESPNTKAYMVAAANHLPDFMDENERLRDDLAEHNDRVRRLYERISKLKTEKEKPVVYLHLYHGREDAEEQLDDWGSEGPTFGPYESIQITYGGHIKMYPEEGPRHELSISNELVHYDGVYYGDFTIFSAAPWTLDKFDQEKA